jgi:hypothetical protein
MEIAATNHGQTYYVFGNHGKDGICIRHNSKQHTAEYLSIKFFTKVHE